MKTTIFYFTGTGNCLQVARDLAAEIPDSQVISISKIIDKEIVLDAKRIGVVFPVYMFGMPLIVKRFFRKIKDKGEDKYMFSIATYGGLAANTLGQNASLLKSLGLKLRAGFLLKMPGNYIPLYEAIPLDKQNNLFSEARKKIKEIAQTVNSNQEGKIEKDSPLARWLFNFIYKMGSPRIPAMDKDFFSDEKCDGCGICSKVCPVNNIEITQAKPCWKHKCEQCMACLQWCPQEAIQYGKNTIGRKRYRNPSIRLEDIL